MAQLKLIRPRVSDVGDEIDLRGFGEDPLIKQADPVCVLSVAGEKSGLEQAQKLLNEYGLATTVYTQDELMHIQVAPQTTGSYKEHAVHLYGVVMYLMGKMDAKHDVSYSLWQADRLRFHLSKDSAMAFDLNNPDLIENVRWDGFMTVVYPVNLHLNQAGFEVSRTKLGMVLDREAALLQTRRELERWQNETAATETKKKAA
ncbi:MAG: hypothetical protein AB7K41_16610 [Bdellovibrionales bacterium]